MANNRVRSKLKDLPRLKAKLKHIKTLHLVFEVGNVRFPASACTSVFIDETLATAQINFKRPGGTVVEHYDLTDITMIRRLRTKKWMIEINGAANPL